MKVSLIVVKGKPEGLEIPLKSARFVVGREKGCQLRPGSDLVSKQHCAFEISSRGLTVVDLGSTNGTFLNGNRVEAEQPVADGDLVKVGPLTFAVKIVIDQPVAKPAPQNKPGAEEDNLFDDWMVESAPAPQPGGSTIMDMRAVNLDDTVAEMSPPPKSGTDSERRVVPPSPASAKKTEKPPHANPDTKADSSKAASDLLQRMMIRRRNG